MMKSLKYFQTYKGTPRYYKKSSVHVGDFRLIKAKEQAKLDPVPVEKIISHINTFLAAINMEQVEFPVVEIIEINNKPIIDYNKLKETYQLRDRRDIVWLKFTNRDHIGVVATSDDVNFNMPESKELYNQKTGHRWAFNTSGIIVHSLGQEWNKSFVLIFPLKNIPEDLTRHDIEKGIGNYLIENNVPILDFYSHNY